MADRVIVVGAGVSGLAAAYRMQQGGLDVTVLEAAGHVGGKTAGSSRDGWSVNTGATVLAGSYDAFLAIVGELGLSDEIVKVPAEIGVVREGTVHWLRGSGTGAIVDFVRTPLLSGRSKLLLARAGSDALRARKKAGYDKPRLRAELDTESVAAYCDRRLNAELRDRLIGPVMGGLFGFDGLRMSVADLFFTLVKVLGGGVLGYRTRIDFFARALAEHLDVRTHAEVTGVRSDAGGADVTWTAAGERHSERVAGVVLTVPAPLVSPLYPGLDPSIQGILNEGLEQANLLSLRFGLSARPPGGALLVVVPQGELDGLATVMFEHNLAPGAAPPARGLVGALLYHEWVTPRLDLSDEELVEAVLPALDAVVPGIAGLVEWTEVTRWTPGALKITQGTHKLVAQIDRLVDPRARVQLAGDYLGIPSINGSVVSGEVAARRLTETLAA